MFRTTITRLTLLAAAVLASVVLAAAPAPAITLSINYAYDTSNFFGSGNPQGLAGGLQAKAAMEAAAAYYSTILDDTFSAIQTPPVYHSSHYNGTVTWSWTMSFPSPGTGATINLTDQTINEDEYRIYVGARSLSSGTLGMGGAGGYSWSSIPTGGFTTAEIDEINAINADFSDAVENRGETSGFADWGGAVTFNSNIGSNWHLNSLTQPTSGKYDFYSVALHELAHTLGFGGSDEWESDIMGSNFIGSASMTAYGGPVPLSPDEHHWAEGTMSTVFGTSVSQETVMDPNITQGTRKLVTTLDAAGLDDIGWDVGAPPSLPGDFNGNGVVDAADYTVWRDNYPAIYTAADYTTWKTHFGDTLGSGAVASAAVAEPSSLVLLALCLSGVILRRLAARA
jgi:hypothetical protein